MMSVAVARECSLKHICQWIFVGISGSGIALLFQNMPGFFLCLVVTAFFIGVASPKLNAALMNEISIERLGTVLGAVNTLLMLFPPLATLGFSLLATLATPRMAVLVLVSVVFGCLGYYQIMDSKSRRNMLK